VFGLLIGVVLGILGKVVYDTVRGPERPATVADLQRRATATLDESRQVLQQLRRTREPASTSEGASAGTSQFSSSESGSAGAVPSSGGSSGGPSAASSLPGGGTSGGGTGGVPGSPDAGSSGSSGAGTRSGSEPGSSFAP